MRILFDISVLGVGHAKPSARAGIFRFTETLLEVLARRDDIEIALCAESNQVDCVRYLREAAPASIRSLALHVDPVKTRLLGLERRLDKNWQAPLRTACDALRVAWATLGIRLDTAAWARSDIYQTPHFMHWPRRFPSGFRGHPFVIHYDLIPLLHPEWFDGPETRSLQAGLDGPIRNWSSISISRSTTDDLVRHAGIAESSIHTIALAADPERFHGHASPSARAAIRRDLAIGDAPFVLALNTLEPRKNVEGAIKAFAEIAMRPGMEDLRLVLAGAKGWKTDGLQRTIGDHPQLLDRIVVAGYVADDLLAALYSEASVFVYLSWYEGFGLPPLEAMACGTPVVCSNTSSLPEVVGDAGLLVDPASVEQASRAVHEILTNPDLHADLSRRGLEQAARFHWGRTADEIVAAWRSVAGK
jgi:glycosyltransferase involved in cell wall biosynthesis